MGIPSPRNFNEKSLVILLELHMHVSIFMIMLVYGCISKVNGTRRDSNNGKVVVNLRL